MKTGYIVGISRGHNAGVCLLKDGEIVFSIEEERLTRRKYDGGPFASIYKILEYTNKVDLVALAHTQPEDRGNDFTLEEIYWALFRKLKLIEDPEQYKDLHTQHHMLHAACSFYNSGFDEAVAIIVDGAGTFVPSKFTGDETTIWEVESIFECQYPAIFNPKWKHFGGRGPYCSVTNYDEEKDFEMIIDDTGGIVKAYEAVTQYCGFDPIDAGKTMGLFPYGKENNLVPDVFSDSNGLAPWKTSNRELVIPTYPNAALINYQRFPFLYEGEQGEDLTQYQSRRDLAYKLQIQSQDACLELIEKGIEKTGIKNVVFSGGYGLNCVANYHYLKHLKDVNYYVEPVSSDAGTAIGAAKYAYYQETQSKKISPLKSLYHGIDYQYDLTTIKSKINDEFEIHDCDDEDVIDLIESEVIVCLYQGKSENGPRALGNRSMLFDPRIKNGKDIVNKIKRREYFRPFAASVLIEHVHDWFDLRGMEESPYMMYAVNCHKDKQKQIPSVIHVDGTCRIQTVSVFQNKKYYDLINCFYKRTGVPLLFNTSFNLAGEPLVETIDDALMTLKESDLRYLYLPENKILLRKK
tara:strand:- start:205 stop:1938 length:1734 start_codon:yes stop_codon:yes gene_type:complete